MLLPRHREHPRSGALTLALAVCLAAALAADGHAQLASAVHVVSAGNRTCPANQCTFLAGTSWFTDDGSLYHLATSNWRPPALPYAAPIARIYLWDVAAGDSFPALMGPSVEMPVGAAFNLLVAHGARGCLYGHGATADNISGNVTFIDAPALDGHPDAFLLVTEAAPTGDPTNVGVYYDGSRLQWGIFNEDGTTMTVGRYFTVYDDSCAIGLGARYVITCSAPQGGDCGEGTVIGYRDSAARLLVTQRWTGVYNPHPVGVYYNSFLQYWQVFNLDGADMPINARFDVALISVLLVDNFETGNTSAWSAESP